MAGVRADQQRLAVMAGATGSRRRSIGPVSSPPSGSSTMHSISHADRSVEAGGLGPLHHPGQLDTGERVRTGAARTRRERTLHRRRTDTDVPNAGSTRGRLAARPGLTPEGVVGRPPLDGVDEAPALLEGASGGARARAACSAPPPRRRRAQGARPEPGLVAASPPRTPRASPCTTVARQRMLRGPGVWSSSREARRRAPSPRSLGTVSEWSSAIVSRFVSTALLQRGGAGARACQCVLVFGDPGPFRNGGGFDLHVELDAPGAGPDAQRLDGAVVVPGQDDRALGGG